VKWPVMLLLLALPTPLLAQVQKSRSDNMTVSFVKYVFGYKPDREYLDRPAPPPRPGIQAVSEQVRGKLDQKLAIKAER
jgi:hypothetical protein